MSECKFAITSSPKLTQQSVLITFTHKTCVATRLTLPPKQHVASTRPPTNKSSLLQCVVFFFGPSTDGISPHAKHNSTNPIHNYMIGVVIISMVRMCSWGRPQEEGHQEEEEVIKGERHPEEEVNRLRISHNAQK